ncbi:MAG: MFS transporter [Gemmatales bacterium]
MTDAAAMPATKPWWHEMTRYHWFVFLVAAVGWLADCMDQQLFVLTRNDALAELMGLAANDPLVSKAGGNATTIFLMGWAVGGLIFGVMGDRIGRVRTMLLTIILYSVFTGISIFATGIWDYSLYRFLTGLGVGGEFAVGVALVAEVMPDRARPYTLGLLQAFSAVGNCTAALVYMGLGMLEMNGSLKDISILGIPLTGWRLAFLFGTIPAAVALLVRRKLKEPQRWAETSAQKRGSYRELFGTPRWRYNALIGLGIGFAAVVGLWGIGFFGVQLAMGVITENLKAEGLQGLELSGKVKIWGGLYSFFLNLGAAFGMILFGYLAQRLSRRMAFFLAFTVAMITTAATFWSYNHSSQTFWLTPLMGFCLLSVFAVLAIYFPELFPTRLRSTGTSFCYNVGRFVAASGPYVFGILVSSVFSESHGYTRIEGLRYAGVVMCSVFLIGIAMLPFAPETKGKPLPE